MSNSELNLAEKSILDMCCGSRMFWFDKQDERAVFTDIRAEQHTLCDGRPLVISPDLIADFRSLPFADEQFPVVVFDPPHLDRVGPKGWQGKKYGKLDRDTWRDDLRAGFQEAFRVLRAQGVLIFKWNETQIPVSQILALTDEKPAIWQRTGKSDKTHWVIFVKSASQPAASQGPDERNMFELWALSQIYTTTEVLAGLRTTSGYWDETATGAEANRLWKLWNSIRAAAPSSTSESREG